MSKDSAMAMISGGPNAAITPPPSSLNGANPQGTEDKKDTPATTAPSDSARFAALAKKEAEFFRRQELYKAERSAFEAEKKNLLESHNRVSKFEELRKQSPREALKFAGLTDAEIINVFAELEDTSSPEEKAAKAAQAEISKFRQEEENKQKEAKLKTEQEQQKKNAETLKSFRSSITALVESDKERFEYCNFHGPIAEELIYETVVQVFEDENTVISAKEAAEMVEAFYEEQDKLMNNLNKRKPKEQAVEEAKEKIEALRPELPGRSMPKTLSSKASATISSAKTQVNETREQKRQRLIEKLGSLGRK